MAADSSIYSLIKPVQQQDSLAQYGDALKIKALMGQGDLQALQMKQAQQGLDDEQAIRSAYQQSGGDPVKLRSLLQGGGQYKSLQTLDKLDLENQAKRATIGKDNAAASKSRFDVDLSKLQHGAALLDTVKDDASWNNALHIGQITGTFAPEFVQKMREQPYNPQIVSQLQAAGITRAQQLEAQNRAATLAETGRHNLSTETNAAGQLAVSRGQLGVAQGNLGVSRDRLAMEQNAPKGVIQQTQDGTFLVDPRAATAQPVVGPDGKQLSGKQMKDIPQSVLTGMMENNRSINKVNQALAAIGGDEAAVPEGMIADKNATGLKGYLPNFALNRIDPKGTDTRALIADIGSLKIHDRSGAAVTASESPRLMPFIPSVNDDAATVAKKLNNFKREYELMQKETGDYYSADNGFKPYKPATAPTNGAKPKATASSGGIKFLGFE